MLRNAPEPPSYKVAGSLRVWLPVAIFLLVTLLQLAGFFQRPAFLAGLTGDLGLSRYTFERILYLLPIIWAAFSFGWKGGAVTSIAAAACMLPRALLGSPVPEDALVETAAVLVVGSSASYCLDFLRKERIRRAQLEAAREELQSQVLIIESDQKRLAVLNRISAIASRSFDLAGMLGETAECIIDMMGIDSVLTYILDEQASELVLGTHRGVSEEFVGKFCKLSARPGSQGGSGSARPLSLIEDIREVPDLIEAAAAEEGLMSDLIAPLMSKRKVVGMILVGTHARGSFAHEEEELIRAVGNQIGVAVENARLYRHERRVAERLRASEGRYRDLFENAHDAIWVHDLGGNIVVANEACEELTGYEHEELIGTNVSKLLAPESLPMARDVKRKLLGGDDLEQPYEQRVIRKDGSVGILKMSASLLTAGGNVVGFQHIARDVTEEIRMQETTHSVLRQIASAQEEERKRIARDLHDDTIQSLVVHGQQIYDLACTMDELHLVAVSSQLEEMRQRNNSIIQELRRLSQDLRPAALDRFGLLPTLDRLASDMEEKWGITTVVDVVGTERRLPAEMELVLFRIVQEALRNICKHAQATSAETTIEFGEGMTRVTVKDNGKGFEAGRMMDGLRSGKLGLAGMQERARLLGGTLTVTSGIGEGTTLVAELPL